MEPDASICCSCGTSVIVFPLPPARGGRLALKGFLLGWALFFVVAYITDEREPMMTVGASIALTIGAAYIIFYLWSWRKEQRTVVGEGAAWLVVALLQSFCFAGWIEYMNKFGH
jgi:hypothetical protein